MRDFASKQRTAVELSMSLAAVTRWLVVVCPLLCFHAAVSAELLEQYRSKHRVVVTFSVATTAPERLELLRQIERYQCEFNDRDLVYRDLIAGSEQYRPLSRRLSVTGHQFRLLLIRKDGDVKIYSSKPNLQSVFALIDAMPMRQKEQRKSVCKSEGN